MDKDDISRWASIFSSSYVNRWLDQHFDEFEKWDVFQKIKGIDKKKKYMLEAILYTLTGYIDHKLHGKNSPIHTIINEISKNSGHQIARRILQDSISDPQIDHQSSESTFQSLSSKLLELEEKDLLKLLAYHETIEGSAQESFIKFTKGSSIDDLSKFSKMSFDEMNNFIQLNHPTAKEEPVEEKGEKLGDKIRDIPFSEFMKNAKDFIFNYTKKGKDITTDVLMNYFNSILWLGKAFMIIWVIGLAMSFLISLSSDNIIKYCLAPGVLLIAGAIAFFGHKNNKSWMKVSGVWSLIFMTFVLLLALTSNMSSVSTVIFLYISLPAILFVIALLPIRVFLDAAQSILPAAYAVASRAIQRIFLILWGVMLFALLLLFLPLFNSPVVVILLVIATPIAIFAVGNRLINVDAERFFSGKSFKVSLCFLAGMLILISMPDISSKIRDIPQMVNDSIVNEPDVANFEQSKDIDFVDKKGRSKIWYARDNDDGFDLYYCNVPGLYLKDGRKLKLAEGDSVRQEIRDWVDSKYEKQMQVKQAALAKQKQVIANSLAQKEKQRQRQIANTIAERKRIDEERRRIEREKIEAAKLKESKRIKSYTSAMPTSKVKYIICAMDEKKNLLYNLNKAVGEKLNATGIKVSSNVFTPEFTQTGAFDTFFKGNGKQDLDKMVFGEISPKLLFIKVYKLKKEPKSKFDTVVVYNRVMDISIIDPSTGKCERKFNVNSTAGAGINENSARDAFYVRFCDALIKQKL